MSIPELPPLPRRDISSFYKEGIYFILQGHKFTGETSHSAQFLDSPT